ncbi:MAG: hypothetical protein PHN71_06570 [Candidatus Cloacimonetes bacterium]|nr:hypothetical protein [Candidatus Cloacimonadota bacterium]MCK9332178.1 hypothetical protein [Candidatus Cloacimonadota bacterium]MDD2210971.1 hypothetical protein [Candidatus Cloacimonadota bacterium]MDY0298689.1 hypothetical protein [Candidatus Cloacimonadaceae bacterium]
MKIFEYKDEHLGKSYIVISKIREVTKALGEIVITFDNGDKRVISVENPDETLNLFIDALNSV